MDQFDRAMRFVNIWRRWDDAAFAAATPVAPKYFATVDPAARWTAANGGVAFFAYATDYLIDFDYAVIVEVTAAKTMVARNHDRFHLQAADVIAGQRQQ